MNKERLELLEWYVQFAQLKLDELKPGDRAKLSIEAGENLFPSVELEQLGIPIEILKEQAKEKEIRFPGGKIKVPSSFRDWALNLPQKDTKEFWNLISHLQEVIQNTLLTLLGPYTEKDGTKYLGLGSLNFAGETQFQISGEENVFKFFYIPLSKTHGEYVELKLYRLMDGLPTTTIMKCPGCDGYFINTSLRIKKFCSSKCMWKVNAQKKRDELKKNPKEYKAYLEKQKERMSKKYDKEIGDKLGKNVKRKKRKGV